MNSSVKEFLDLVVAKSTSLSKTFQKFLKKDISSSEVKISPKNVNDDEEFISRIKALGILTFPDLSSFQFEGQLAKKVPYSFVKKHMVLPVQEKDSEVLVATHNPFDLDAIEELRFFFGKKIETVFVPKQAIVAAIHEYYHQDEESRKEIEGSYKETTAGDIDSSSEVYDLLDDQGGLSPAVRLINYSIQEAIQQGSSDIHFEPEESGLLIRYRIDGVLQNRFSPSTELQSQLLTRLKVMAKLDIAEKRLPQDGRIKMRLGGKEVDFRMSTLPTVTGERIVLRILDKGNIVLGLDQIGMPENMLHSFRSGIQIPEGIILVTGPTGSGKTTTLYSALSELKSEECNIMTIEDPVEYRLKGIAQIGVHPKIGLTFAAGLRHILRQDPDTIMVGEIRDKETAEIAIQAALTGHLVLSTLHTNDAPSAIVRLADMGIEPYLISSCVIAILAQRLVRKICSSCKVAYEPSVQELENLNLTLNELPGGVLYRGKGCNECLNSGYRGRHGVYELMTLTAPVKKQILISPEASTLQNVCQKLGMKKLRDHGKMLVLEGITTIDEVWRVTRAGDEE